MARTKPSRGRRFGDAHGTGAMIGLMIGTGIFTASFATVVTISQRELAEAPLAAEEASREGDSARLALEILSQPGSGWYAVACSGLVTDFTPDKIQRFGLASEPCGTVPGALNLSYVKVQNLRKAGLQANPVNGHVDYAEARRSLGLGDGSYGLAGDTVDFNVTSRIVLPDAANLLRYGNLDPTLRPLYIGDYAEKGTKAGPNEPEKVCGKTQRDDGVEVWIEATNSGIDPVALNAKFSLQLKKGTVESYKWTPRVNPDATHKLVLFLPKSNDWSWKGHAEVDIRLKDDDGTNLGSCKVDLRDAVLLGATAKLILRADDYYVRAYLTAGGVVEEKLVYTAFNGKGEVAFDATHVLGALGTLGSTLTTDPRWHENGYKILPPVTEQEFRVTLKTLLGAELGHDDLYLPKGDQGDWKPAPAKTSYEPQPSAVAEAAYLDKLVAGFDPYVYSETYDHALLPHRGDGDVVPDLKKALDAHIPVALLDAAGRPTFVRYNILVVGSNVEHETMTSGAVKDTVEDWVRAGGTLIVLGSNQQSVQWLQPLFHTGLQSASGTAHVDKPFHRILTVPNRLQPETYSDNGKAWSIGAQDLANFDVVSSHGDATLAVSKPGAIGEGRVAITSFRAYDLDGQGPTGECDPAQVTGNCEGLRLLQNLLTIAYDDLNLDYGPAPPAGVAVASVSRVATVYVPRLGQHVEVSVRVTVF